MIRAGRIHMLASDMDPWRQLRTALFWLLGAELVSLLAAVIFGFAIGLSRSMAHGGMAWNPNPLLDSLVHMLALQVTILLGILRESRRLGISARPMQRKGLVCALAGLAASWVLAYFGLILHVKSVRNFVLHEDVPPALILPDHTSPQLIAVWLIIVVVFAPLAEEWFFRGWLWTALRQAWSVWPTAICTSTLWLAMHALEGPTRVLVLLPAATLLCLARHYGASARASLVVHVVNNATAGAIQLALIYLQTHPVGTGIGAAPDIRMV